MAKRTNISIVSKIDGQPISELLFAYSDDISTFISAIPTYREQPLLQDLKQVLSHNENDIVRMLTHEIGKPLSQSREEVRKAIDFLEYFNPERSSQEKREKVLILGSIAEPIYELVTSLAQNIYVYEKVLYKPSTKASATTHFIYQKLINLSESIKTIFLVAAMSKETLDKILEKTHFDTIINYSRGKLHKNMNVEIRNMAEPDKILLLDNKSDLEVASAMVIDNLFSFTKFNSYRLQHIFIEESVINDFTAKLLPKMDLFLSTGRPDEPDVNFTDTFKTYKRNSVRETLLEILSMGADLVYGSLDETLRSPIIFKCKKSVEEEYKNNIWAPVIFLIEYKDITQLGTMIKPFRSLDALSLLAPAHDEYLKKRVGMRFI